MLRRSFRIGVRLGLLAGAVFALTKIFRPKATPSSVLDLGVNNSPASSASQWPPLEAAVATPTPVPVPDPDVEPVVATDEPGLITIGDEPLQEPVAPPAPGAPAPAVGAAPPTPAAPVAAAAPAPPAPAPPVPKPAPAKKKAAAPKTSDRVAVTWVDPKDNVCPKSHPVKAKMSSMIFQIPGNFAYDRTNPDRCYESAAAASADGLRPAKR